MAGIPPITTATDTEVAAPLGAAERYAGDNVYALSTTSSAAATIASAPVPFIGTFIDTSDAVTAVPSVVGTTIDRIA